MKLLYSSFAFFTAAFLLIQFHSFLNLELPAWILFYGKDFICMPIVLTICLVTVQLLKQDRRIHLSLFMVLSLALFYSLFFELYLANFHNRYTADWLDVLMYFAGALLFYFLQDKNKEKNAVDYGK